MSFTNPQFLNYLESNLKKYYNYTKTLDKYFLLYRIYIILKNEKGGEGVIRYLSHLLPML